VSIAGVGRDHRGRSGPQLAPPWLEAQSPPDEARAPQRNQSCNTTVLTQSLCAVAVA
jgi:hypothetical protein